MFIYSKKIVQFIHQIKSAIQVILAHEVGVKVSGGRFFDYRQRASYPLKVVIYNDKSMLGYFDPEFYELGFHERLMHTSREQLHQVIRHELAHYMTFILHGEMIQSHGPEFRAFCQQLGWGEGVYRATFCLETIQNAEVLEESAIFRKVKKLMALATSSNAHEAEQAMIKSQQLLLKHNMEASDLGNEDEEKVVLKRIMKQKKTDGKLRAIVHILETFFVSAVFHRAGGFIYLEILGSAVNVEIAEYVATVLNDELERLWIQAKKEANLKGLIAKNSFFLGLAKGYCNQIQALKRAHQGEISSALITLERQLIEAKAMVYQRLSSSSSRANHCRESSLLGEKIGRLLNIHPAINRSTNQSTLLLLG